MSPGSALRFASLAAVGWLAAAVSVVAAPVVQERSEPRVGPSTRSGFVKFTTPPLANGQGGYVFHGFSRDGRAGIWYSNGGGALPVAQVGAALPIGGDQSLAITGLGNDPGLSGRSYVVFRARFEGGSAIVGRDGPFGELKFIADVDEAFRSFSPCVRVNDKGDVAFHAMVDPKGHPDRDDYDPRDLLHLAELPEDPDDIPPDFRFTRNGMKAAYHEGLFLDDGKKVLVVGGTQSDFTDVAPRFVLTQAGQVVYRAWGRDGNESVFWHGGFARPLPLARAGVRYKGFGDLAANEQGDVVFWAEESDGITVVLHGRNGRLTPRVAARGSEKTTLRPGVAVDAEGWVYFVARARKQDTLIRSNQEGRLEPLLRSGDPVSVQGQPCEVATIRLSSQPFIDRRNMVLLLEVEPEGQAVVILPLRGA